jgi:hypothetical protein
MQAHVDSSGKHNMTGRQGPAGKKRSSTGSCGCQYPELLSTEVGAEVGAGQAHNMHLRKQRLLLDESPHLARILRHPPAHSKLQAEAMPQGQGRQVYLSLREDVTKGSTESPDFASDKCCNFFCLKLQLETPGLGVWNADEECGC